MGKQHRMLVWNCYQCDHTFEKQGEGRGHYPKCTSCGATQTRKVNPHKTAYEDKSEAIWLAEYARYCLMQEEQIDEELGYV